MGYEGWLWSHGIPWEEITARMADMRTMYEGDYSILQEYGVDYICIGPYERAFAEENRFTINEAAFGEVSRFRLVYDEVLGGKRWKIYQLSS